MCIFFDRFADDEKLNMRVCQHGVCSVSREVRTNGICARAGGGRCHDDDEENAPSEHPMCPTARKESGSMVVRDGERKNGHAPVPKGRGEAQVRSSCLYIDRTLR